ncbi:MAG: hypothetical protein AAGE89_14465 [Pseudomonadota bacterium]
MDYSVALLIFGILLLLVGLIGRVKAKELEVGTANPVTRVVVGVIGVGLVALSLLISPAGEILSGLNLGTGGRGSPTDPSGPVYGPPHPEPAEPEPAGPPPGPGPEADAEDSTLPPLRARIAVVAMDDRLGTLTAEALARSVGANLEVFPHNGLQELGIYNPDLIVIAADTARVWPEMSDRVLRALFDGQKIVGLGTGGSELFRALGATIGKGHAAHFGGSNEVTLANFPSGHIDRPDLPRDFPVHRPGRFDVQGIYDGGSPALQGFEAFANVAGHDHHWPVVRQGNLLFWGFDAPLNTLTNEGRLLLHSLLKDHLERPYISFEARLPEVEVFPPGRHAERLTGQFSGQTWHIRLARPGMVRALVDYDPEHGPVALILNGPGQVGYFERKNGVSPLEIRFEVTPELLERGDVWRVSVKKFGPVPRPIDYTIELDFPG